MDTIREDFYAGRRNMIDAYVELKMLALERGLDWEIAGMLDGLFFDGNVGIKQAFGSAVLLAEIRAQTP